MKKRVVIIAATVLVMGTMLFGAEKSKVLMKVGKEVITEQDLNNALDQMPDQYKQYYSTDEGKKQLLERIAEQKMLAIKAKEMKLDKTKEFDIKMENAKEMVLAQLIVEKIIIDGVKVTDEEIREEYDSKKDDTLVKISQIVINIDEDSNDDDKEETRKKAENILKEASKGEETFEEFVEKYSEDEDSKENGGDLGYLDKENMEEEVAEIAFSTEIGEVATSIIETISGYKIIKVTDIKNRYEKEFDEEKEEIKNKLLEKKRYETYDKLKEHLQKQYPVQ